MFTLTIRQYVIILPVLVGTTDRDASCEMAAVTVWGAFRTSCAEHRVISQASHPPLFVVNNVVS